MQTDLEKLKKQAEINIKFQGNFFTVVTATMTIGNTIFYAEGIARRSRLDEYSAVGIEIAMGRALKSLAMKIKKDNRHYQPRHRFMA
jgi:hypothetical protein